MHEVHAAAGDAAGCRSMRPALTKRECSFECKLSAAEREEITRDKMGSSRVSCTPLAAAWCTRQLPVLERDCTLTSQLLA